MTHVVDVRQIQVSVLAHPDRIVGRQQHHAAGAEVGVAVLSVAQLVGVA